MCFRGKLFNKFPLRIKLGLINCWGISMAKNLYKRTELTNFWRISLAKEWQTCNEYHSLKLNYLWIITEFQRTGKAYSILLGLKNSEKMPPIEVERLLEDQRTRTKWNRITPFIVRFLSLYFALRNVYVFRLTIQHPHLVVSIGSGSIYSECYRSIYSIKESNVQSFYLNENVRLCVSALYANGSANTSSRFT